MVGQALRVSERRPETETRLIDDSEAMRAIRATIQKLAHSPAPYISGESGTGKELVAHNIHGQGPRRVEAPRGRCGPFGEEEGIGEDECRQVVLAVRGGLPMQE